MARGTLPGVLAPLLGIAFTIPAAAQQQPSASPPAATLSADRADVAAKAAQLTLEERASARQAEIARQRKAAVGSAEHKAVRLSGAATPELFLPIELFRHLILISCDRPADAAEHVRGGLAERAGKAGITLPADFWPRLESISASYIESNRAVTLVSERLRPTARGPEQSKKPDPDRDAARRELHALRSSQCELRQTALRNARLEFGQDWFDRFLYAAVAPIINIVISGNEPSEPAALLRDVQGGCQ